MENQQTLPHSEQPEPDRTTTEPTRATDSESRDGAEAGAPCAGEMVESAAPPDDAVASPEAEQDRGNHADTERNPSAPPDTDSPLADREGAALPTGRALLARHGESAEPPAPSRPEGERPAGESQPKADSGSGLQRRGGDDASRPPGRSSGRARRLFLYAASVLVAAMAGWTGGILGYPRGGALGNAADHLAQQTRSAEAGALGEAHDWKSEFVAVQRESASKLDRVLDVLGRAVPPEQDVGAKLDALSAKLDRIERPVVSADAVPPTSVPTSAQAPDRSPSDESVRQLRDALQSAQQDLMARLDQALTRLDRIERAGQAAAKQEQTIQNQDRIERRTASAAYPGRTPPTGPSRMVMDTDGKQARTARLEGWSVRSVHNGVALVEGPRGMVEVEEGDSLPGVGRIKAIARQTGRWIVQTSRGVISAIEP